MSLKKFENSFDNNHQKLGLALYGAILVQGLIGFFRPHRFIHQNSHLFLQTCQAHYSKQQTLSPIFFVFMKKNLNFQRMLYTNVT